MYSDRIKKTLWGSGQDTGSSGTISISTSIPIMRTINKCAKIYYDEPKQKNTTE